MALREIERKWHLAPIPDAAAGFIVKAEEGYAGFWDTGGRRRFPRYVPSEPELVYAALQQIVRDDLLLGRVFCEWGSGFGVATGLAALLGFEAHGVEIEEPLVDYARSLHAHCKIRATLIHASYFPEGYTSYSGWGGDQLVEDASSNYDARDRTFSPRYEGMAYDLDEIDLFFVYPWPGEQEMMLGLFDTLAGDGALLLAYYGESDLCLYQRVPEAEDGDYGEEDW